MHRIPLIKLSDFTKKLCTPLHAKFYLCVHFVTYVENLPKGPVLLIITIMGVCVERA